MFILLKSFLTVLLILILVAYYTLLERKVMASIQRRRGPNIVGIFGMLQPIADGLKAILKEIIIPRYSNNILFILSPIIIFTTSFQQWIFIPVSSAPYTDFSSEFMWSFTENTNFGILYIFAISSITTLGVLLAGCAGNSKYALLGSVRAASQLISYEIILGLSILPVLLCSQGIHFNIIALNQQHHLWHVFPLLPVALNFYISGLAETNRTPFDLPESEAEIVAGPMTEFSSIIFAFFFLGEYSNMMLMSFLTVLLFCGAWFIPFLPGLVPEVCITLIKVFHLCILVILIRAILPRYKFNFLLKMAWTILLPIALCSLIVTMVAVMLGK